MSPSKVEQPLDFTTFSNIINGELRTTSETRTGINPSTKKPLPAVPVSTKKDVDDAVAAAAAAQPKWAAIPLEKRNEIICKYADLLEQNKEAFAEMMVKEQGKPYVFASGEIDGAIERLKETTKITLPDKIVEETDNHKTTIRYVPIGVGAGIVPWNFPVNLATWKLGPAVQMGNAIIIKPSPFTPYCGLKLVELAQRVFPPGVVQALSGDDDLGPWLTEHPGIHKIAFTGSSATGKRVMASCAKTLKRCTLELGGNDPAIVCPDVDIAKVAPKIAFGSFFNTGQVCVCMKRIYVHADIYDAFRDAMANAAKNFPVGDGMEKTTMLGPIQNQMQFGKVKEFFEDSKMKQMKFALGGDWKDSDGFFVDPTIVDNPDDDSRIVTEEPFGPIVPILKWTDEADVIRRANNTDMGLASSVWSKDLDRAQRIASQIQAGTVWINEYMALHAEAPFGGHKQSGIGSEGGTMGLAAWTNVQTVTLNKNLDDV